MDAMLRGMSSRQLSEWQAYERISGPLGAARADLHAGIIAATIANANRPPKSKPFRPADFIPKWDHQPQPVHQMKALARALNAAFGGMEVSHADAE